MRVAVETIWKRDKSAFSVLDILIAVRGNGKKKVLDTAGNCVDINTFFESVDGVLEFLEGTGLMEIFRERKVNSLVDYVFGIETGLDTNARKNRSGHIMERVVEEILIKHNLNYRSEVYSKEWPEISKVLGKDNKRFDFVIETRSVKYLVEVNFYSGGGSKLNEVARAYSDIGPKINSVPGFEFLWITDGIGWFSAENKLHEAYNLLPNVYNLTDIEPFLSGLS